MLHHYNYPTSLSHFLSYHQLDDQNTNENDHLTQNLCEDMSQEEDSRCRSNSSASHNKSFTIAAILGLTNDSKDKGNSASDLNGMNLSVHQGGTDRGSFVSNCGRLQLPVHRHGSSTVSVAGHYPWWAWMPPSRQTVRGTLKHMSPNGLQNKKSCKSKRVRTIFTPEQLERLEAEFERQQYMVGPERLYLAHTLQLTEAQGLGFSSDPKPQNAGHYQFGGWRDKIFGQVADLSSMDVRSSSSLSPSISAALSEQTLWKHREATPIERELS
ncbi:hypothetical protein NQ317_008552 [Molorchus minor]|uniref:Homeobox domain-containing protein n=1 Tax=Molorchus minor TaxID=1323400 RepID=A0ABQ9JP93_9CUCU|nr:hypothetical protein NQ317_008552 [Molorchus minor]